MGPFGDRLIVRLVAVILADPDYVTNGILTTGIAASDPDQWATGRADELGQELPMSREAALGLIVGRGGGCEAGKDRPYDSCGRAGDEDGVILEGSGVDDSTWPAEPAW